MSTPVEVIARCLNVNSYVLMTYGCGFGLLLGNSSATKLMVTPFVGMGVIDLEQVNEECCESIYCCMIIKPLLLQNFAMLISILSDVSLESRFKCRIFSRYNSLSPIY